jgi:two-component system, chemotaxis family, protein-glutamate methylesterase/glutaminase
MTDPRIKVMVVDDAVVIRGMVKRMVENEPDIEIVTSATNGEQAVSRLKETPVDVIVLDIEMPVMDGLTALPKLLSVDPDVKILMSSTLTLANAEISMQALQLGATDYIPKPTSVGAMGSASDFKTELINKIRSIGQTRIARRARRLTPRPAVGRTATTPMEQPKKSLLSVDFSLRPVTSKIRPEIIAIGSSTGGPKALFEVLNNLQPTVTVPVIITQHMPANFTAILAKHIQESSGRPCAEAKDGDSLLPGHIYVAPGGYHMIVEGSGMRKVLRINQDPPENFCRPAVDPMFRSVASAYGSRALAVVLTGMGSDGSKGGKAIIDAGGTLIAQDEKTSVVWGMPGAAAAAGLCSAVLPLDQMARYISDFLLKGAA